TSAQIHTGHAGHHPCLCRLVGSGVFKDHSLATAWTSSTKQRAPSPACSRGSSTRANRSRAPPQKQTLLLPGWVLVAGRRRVGLDQGTMDPSPASLLLRGT